MKQTDQGLNRSILGDEVLGRISAVDAFTRRESSEKLDATLDPSVRPEDVLCGRGKVSFSHAGNKRFRDAVESSIEEYVEATDKEAKAAVVQAIIDKISSVGGRFIKKDFHKNTWVELTPQQCREKVGHALRDTAKSTCQKRDEISCTSDKKAEYDTKWNAGCTSFNAKSISRESLFPQKDSTTSRQNGPPSETYVSGFYNNYSVPSQYLQYMDYDIGIGNQQQYLMNHAPPRAIDHTNNYVQATMMGPSSSSVMWPSNTTLSEPNEELIAFLRNPVDHSRAGSGSVDPIANDELLAAVKSALAPAAENDMFDMLCASMNSLQMSNSSLNFDHINSPSNCFHDSVEAETMNLSLMSLAVFSVSSGSSGNS